jgi:hypothetical protein
LIFLLLLFLLLLLLFFGSHPSFRPFGSACNSFVAAPFHETRLNLVTSPFSSVVVSVSFVTEIFSFCFSDPILSFRF